MADKLSEAGHSVLLIEKGPASTAEWGGNMGPDWLNGTDLTRFDVPGLCNQIWHDSGRPFCTHKDYIAMLTLLLQPVLRVRIPTRWLAVSSGVEPP